MAESLSNALDHLSLSHHETLPVELWLLLVEHLDQPSAASLSLTSHFSRTAALPRLFRRIAIQICRINHVRGLARLKDRLAFYTSSKIIGLVQDMAVFGGPANRMDEMHTIFAAMERFPHLQTLFIRYVRLRAAFVPAIVAASRRTRGFSLSLVACAVDSDVAGVLEVDSFCLTTDMQGEPPSAHAQRWTQLLSPTALRILDVAQPRTTQDFLYELLRVQAPVFLRVQRLSLCAEALLVESGAAIARAFPGLVALELVPRETYGAYRLNAHWALPTDGLPYLVEYHGPSIFTETICAGGRSLSHLKLYNDARNAQIPSVPTHTAATLTSLHLDVALSLSTLIESLSTFTALRALRVTIPFINSPSASAWTALPQALADTLLTLQLPPTLEAFFLSMYIRLPPRATISYALAQLGLAIRSMGQRHADLRLRRLNVLLFPPQGLFGHYRWTAAQGPTATASDVLVTQTFAYHDGGYWGRRLSPFVGWKRNRERPTAQESVEARVDDEWEALVCG
uniref:F-box domain-containing protein n=1 Tax=Mycena chlorophos TaxID=658473 RepID=A0ABQ0L806_MYCCL|nr:predicted protein [Mycena chlorophos]